MGLFFIYLLNLLLFFVNLWEFQYCTDTEKDEKDGFFNTCSYKCVTDCSTLAEKVGRCKCDNNKGQFYGVHEIESESNSESENGSCYNICGREEVYHQFYNEASKNCECYGNESVGTIKLGDLCFNLTGKTFNESLQNFLFQSQIPYPFTIDSTSKRKGTSTTYNIVGSDTFAEDLKGCEAGFSRSCERIANFCVLSLYDQNLGPCKYIQDKYKERENKSECSGYYSIDFCGNQPSFQGNINSEVTVDRENSFKRGLLKFRIKKYDIEGNYLGIEDLKNELILCTSKYEDGIDFRLFGSTIQNECTIDLLKFENQTNYRTLFYELLYADGDNNEIEVPVLLTSLNSNLIRADDARLYVSSEDIKNIINNNSPEVNLVKRFVIMDNYFGHSSNENQQNIQNKTLYPRVIKLHTILQTKKDESKIYLPLLEILHIPADLSSSTGGKLEVDVSFVSEYSMDLKNFMKAATAILIVLTVIAAIVIAARMYVWTKLNPSILSPDNYCLWFCWTLIMKTFKYWGLFMFFFAWGISAYWYIFFKLQYNGFILPPPLGTFNQYYKKFEIVWGLACAFYGIYMFQRIAQQTNFEIFFVDWEHDKDLLVNNMDNIKSKKYRGAWRGLHIANQFNELQKQRTINIPFCFCWLIFLWYFQDTKWMKYATSVPVLNDVENSPENYILRHFIATFVLFIAGITQYFVVRLVQLWLPLKKTEFLDLCSVSNISVFILDQSLHGYYIHGQSPLGRSDTNLDELLKFLEEEGKGKIRGRGVTDDQNDDLQSYEIFLSYSMRTIYDGLYYVQTRTTIDRAEGTDKLHNQSRLPNFFQYIPKTIDVQSVYFLNNYMNTQLKNKIGAVSSQSNIFIKEKTKCERFLDFPPNIDLISPDAKEMVFYKDPNMNFDDILFTGMEFEWLILVIYFFQMWALSLEKYKNSLPLSIFMTFVCERILYRCRIFFGEKNVARKAVIDNRFFS